jgi:hypothetical protein
MSRAFATNVFVNTSSGSKPTHKLCVFKMEKIIFSLLLILPSAYASSPELHGLPPDCWTEDRLIHGNEESDPWQKNIAIAAIKGEKPKPGVLSPNKGYFYVQEGSGRPNAKITIYAEKDHLIQINISELFGLSDLKWINEKLIFIRVWWGRRLGTDLIFDVETERILYVETVVDGALVRRQAEESCPLLGCQCIKKK